MEYGKNRATLISAMSYCAENLRQFAGMGTLNTRECEEIHFKAGLSDKLLFNRILDCITDKEFDRTAGSTDGMGQAIPLMKNVFYGRFLGD